MPSLKRNSTSLLKNAGGSLIHTCATGCAAIPSTFTITVSSGGGNCSGFNGTTVTMTKSGSEWTGSASMCGSTLNLKMTCTDGPTLVTLEIVSHACLNASSNSATPTFSPFAATFGPYDTGANWSNCSGGGCCTAQDNTISFAATA